MERGEQLGGSMRFGLVFSVLAIAVAARADAQQPSTPTHLCAPAEVALFNSRMGMSTWNDMRTRKKLKGDKILSLCVDRLAGAKKLAVRFGKPNAVPDVDVVSPNTRFRLTTQDVGGGETWTALRFTLKDLDWAVVQPEGGDARDLFLLVSRAGQPLARTEAIDEGEHWAFIKKRFGKKKFRDVPANLSDLPSLLAARGPGDLNPDKISAARYVANLSLPK